MSKRRSLDDALTPEQEAFLSPGGVSTSNIQEGDEAKPQADQPQSPPVRIIFAPAMPTTETQKNSGGWLVPLTTRIGEPLMQALIRASMERKLQRIEPCSQQDIVSEALAAWLNANNYI